MTPARKAKGRRKGQATGKPVKSHRRGTDNPGDVMLGGVGLAEIRRLIRLVQRTGIGELEITANGRTIRVSANTGSGVSSAMASSAPPVGRPEGAAGTPGSGGSAASTAPVETHVAITSPMVGTFYRAPAPDADPYVEAGDAVEVGQTVCIIEAMKLMNEIESEVRGKVVKILVENAQPVEFGQRLFLVEPT